MSEPVYHKEKYAMRFVEITSIDLDVIKALLQGVVIKARKWKDGPNYVVLIDIEPDSDLSALAQFIAERSMPESNFGVWASLVTESDSDGLCVPDYVLKWIRCIGGAVNFSFTSV